MAKNTGWGVAAAMLALLCASPAAANARCEAERQDVAVTRAGKIAGLGNVAGAIYWDGTKVISLTAPEFVVTRTIRTSGGVEITVAGSGEAPLVIRFGGGAALSIARGNGRAADGRNSQALRGLLSGRAVAAFRERMGEYERHLIAAGPALGIPEAVAPHADGFLLAAAFIASADGDPTAVGRARDLLLERVRGRLRAVRLEFRDCVTEYEQFLLKIDETRTQCLEAANNHDSWYERSAQRLLCEAEFMANALSAEGQFISCTALFPLMGA